MKIRSIILSLLLSACWLCATAQIFYKIEGNGLPEPSYLFGTHHLAPLSVIENHPLIKEALAEAKAVVGEIDMTRPQMELAMAMQPYMIAPPDSTLSRLLTQEQLDSLNVKFAPYAPMPGMSLSRLDMMRPMVISTMVTMGEMMKSLPRFDPNAQLDSYFQLQAKENGKEVVALETPEMQAKLLYTFTPISKQLEDLKEVLDNPAELIENFEKVNEAYKDGDLETLLAMTESEDSDPAFMEALLTLRNQNWMMMLPEIMSSRSSFIAVGALHLAGEQGLVNLLRNAGYSVYPL